MQIFALAQIVELRYSGYAVVPGRERKSRETGCD
jgi:hypothetical protein